MYTSKYATKPNENSRLENSVNPQGYKKLTGTSFLNLKTSIPFRPVESELERGKIRRKCELLEMARKLGNEHLLEVWEE